MKFDFENEEQQMIRDVARNFFAKEWDGQMVRQMIQSEKGFTPEMWGKMAELGWMGLLIPEKYEGFDMSHLEMSILLYEMGYVCMPGPFFSTAVLGVMTLLEGGNDRQKREILPEVASGERFLTVAWTEPGGRYTEEGISLNAEKEGDEYVLSGTKLFVPDAHVADTIFCAARTQNDSSKEETSVSLFIVDRKVQGLRVRPLSTFTGEKVFEVVFDQVRVSPENVLGQPGEGMSVLKKVREKAAVAKCAEMSGGAQKVLEMAVDYAKEREQFGQPIGSFQAIQHHCADILTLADSCKFMTFQASWRISEGLSSQKESSMCKAWVSESYRRLIATGIQILGGTGFMEEHDIHLYYNRAKAAELAFGDAGFHREIVAQQMGL
jgi:alkylation response protein AidB-like acyl-CoA dehydrogenase